MKMDYLTTPPDEFPFETDMNEWTLFVDSLSDNQVWMEHELIAAVMEGAGEPRPAEKNQFEDLRYWVAARAGDQKYQEYFRGIGEKLMAWLRTDPQGRVEGSAMEIYFRGNPAPIHIGLFNGRTFAFVPRKRNYWKNN